MTTAKAKKNSNSLAVFSSGAVIGSLGGLIGLGGAEFRLPLLISLFRFPAIEAIILNKAMSLVVVASALLFRSANIPFASIMAHQQIILTLLSGSLIGAWLGADWVTRIQSHHLYKMIAILLFGIGVILLFAHDVESRETAFDGWLLKATGAFAGFIIGVVASILGVAGGELLIPTFVLLFGLDIKLAGSLALIVSLPTMLIGFIRFSRDKNFAVIAQQKHFIVLMAIGSIIGAFIGGYLLGIVSSATLLPLLASILVVSSFKIWTHK